MSRTGLTYMMTDFDAFMDAVTNAYGRDIWNTISNDAKLHSSEFADMITAVDGVDAVYLKNGDVAYYTYNGSFVGNASTIENAVNSNASAGRVLTEVRQPAELSVEAQTGEVVATSGMKTVSGGAKVAATMGKVATGVAAVATGVQLGAIIDSALYNANPDFWDEHGMSALNPQTWDSLCSTQEGKDVFNFVFGINKESGETQAYIDEEAFAYIAAYMASQGAFSGSETICEITQEEKQSLYLNNTTSINLSPTPIYFNMFGSVATSQYEAHASNDTAKCCWYGKVNEKNSGSAILFADTVRFNVIYTPPGDSPQTLPTSQITMLGKTYYYRLAMNGGSYPNNPSNFSINGVFNELNESLTIEQLAARIAYIMLYGTETSTEPVEGISKQDGATLPTGITAGMTIPEVLAYLQTTYPDLWDDAIENNVIQPDGSVKKYTYIPTGMPDNIPVDQITGQLKPTGGVDMLQGQLPVTPTSPQNIQGSLLNVATTQSAYNPQADLDDPNTPDTGEGNTPPAVLPTGSAQALYAVYNPSQSEVNSFGAWLWDSNFFEQLKKLFNDPMQSIIGLHKIFATPSVSGRGDIYVGYLDSGVPSNLVANQYTEVDCGEVSLYEYFGNVLDYSATDIYIYLPFIGIVPLDVEDIMRATINVKYKVDVLTGACLVMINVTRDGAGGQLYTYSGNCSVQYPLSSGSYMGIVASAVGIAGSIAGTILTGGAMLPVAIGAGASALNNMKSKVEHSGSLSGNAGAMGIKKPYLIIRRPQTAIADNFEKYKGGSNNIYGTLSTFHGFTQVKYVNLEGFTKATLSELLEIERLLKSGVLIN